MRLLFVLFLFSFSLRAEVLTQTVGTSAFQVITSREVKALDLIARALEKELRNPPLDLSQDAINRTLFEVAIYRESQSLAAIKVDTGEIAALVASAKAKLQKNPEWKKLEVSEDELKSWVERKKVATEYMRLKSSALTTIVTDQEVQDYYEKNRVKFGSTPLESQKANIRLFLQKESQKLRVQEWMAALKAKYQIRNDLVDMASVKAAEPTAESNTTEKSTGGGVSYDSKTPSK